MSPGGKSGSIRISVQERARSPALPPGHGPVRADVFPTIWVSVPIARSSGMPRDWFGRELKTSFSVDMSMRVSGNWDIPKPLAVDGTVLGAQCWPTKTSATGVFAQNDTGFTTVRGIEQVVRRPITLAIFAATARI